MNDDLRGRSLLAVFAHPDDESLACGGLLAWCSELGVRVSLLCATHGEHGAGSELALGETRRGELEAAARVLGVSDLVLLDYPDGMLPWVDAVALEADIRAAIRRIRPEVVITFGEDGLYWHPDHIAIHERTTAVVAELGPADAAAPALYYVTMPPGSMRAVVNNAVEKLTRQGSSGQPPRLILGINEADAFGALAAAPTLIVDAGDFAARKLAAIKCHRTQLGDSALALVAESEAARFIGIEHFRRAEVGSGADAFIERFATGA
jgi:LmbE family N-acetylglucosaminyl deacetylase